MQTYLPLMHPDMQNEVKFFKNVSSEPSSEKGKRQESGMRGP